LPELRESPNAAVIFTEGEKKADRVPELFPGYVGTTSMHGSKSPHLSDWAPCAGHEIIIWPDHDQPGRDYADTVAVLATAAGATSVRIVAVPDSWPNTWDLADPLPEGYADDALINLLQSAQLWTAIEPEPEKSSRKLPIVKIGGGQLSSAIDQAELILIDRDKGLFQRGDFVVRPAPAAILIADNKKTTGIRLVRVRTAHMIEFESLN
jgi:hypothetical protein